MTEKYYKAINWNDMEDRVDKSAWSRLNDHGIQQAKEARLC